MMMDHDELQRAVVHLARDNERRFWGKYRGIVTDVADPNTPGRIKAKVPELFDDEATGWAMPCVPYAPPHHGFLVLPEPESNVWIEFEGGDVSRPIWSGAFWPDGTAPAAATEHVKLLETKGETKITFDDTSGSESLKIEIKSGAKITLDQNGIVLEFSGQKVALSNGQIAFNDSSMTVM